MNEFMLALGAALWLGILTSISPCPLATNIAAISFLSRHIEKPWRTFVFGLLYTVGRILSYVAVGLLVMVSLVSIPSLSLGLQTWMNRLIGPLLVIIGLYLLNVLKLNIPGLGFGPGGRIERLANRGGYLGAALLGSAFALSFCPVSAALFFGSLVPLALANQPGTAMFSIYGVGTARPGARVCDPACFCQSLGDEGHGGDGERRALGESDHRRLIRRDRSLLHLDVHVFSGHFLTGLEV